MTFKVRGLWGRARDCRVSAEVYHPLAKEHSYQFIQSSKAKGEILVFKSDETEIKLPYLPLSLPLFFFSASTLAT